MKTLKEIKAEILKNRESRKAKKEEIKKLNYEAEKSAVVKSEGRFNSIAFHELCEKARANAGKVAALEDEIYKEEIESRILYDNARAAFLSESLPVILNACAKYNGKQYGPKTRDAIHAEAKKAGIGFYFESKYNYMTGEAYELDENGYTKPDGLSVKFSATQEGHNAYFITKDNKLNIANVEISNNYKYTEDTAGAAANVAKAIKNYIAALKALDDQKNELEKILPNGIPQPPHLTSYNVDFF